MVVDTSALMAIVLDEPAAADCADCLERETDLAIAAPTLTETLIVAGRRGVRAEVERLVTGLGIEVVPLGTAGAVEAADAYEKWGKGRHEAGLNFGDCFAYALARQRRCALLYVGEDFARTDVASAEHETGQ